MHLFLLLLCCFLRVYSSEVGPRKCCGEGDHLTLENSTYICTGRDTPKRFQILTNTFNFFGNNADGQCVDISPEGIFLYKIRNSSVEAKDAVNNVFRKCCPLKHVYDTVTHSCKFNANKTESYFSEQKFLEIGLKQCNVVEDKEFSKYVSIEKSSKVHCVDQTQKNTFVLRECEGNMEICKTKRCVKKCCPEGQSFVRGKNCLDTFTHGINFKSFPDRIENPEDNFTIVYNVGCSLVYPWADSINFTIMKNGTLRYWKNMSHKFIYDDVFSEKSYCIDHAVTKQGTTLGYKFFYCSEETKLEAKYAYSKWSKILSSIGLVLTIVVYVVLQETKTIFGKLLVNYCIASLGTMISLLYAHSLPDFRSYIECQTRAFFLIVFSNAQFTLLNAMGLDIWWNFGRIQVNIIPRNGTPRQTISSESRRKNLKRLLLYLSYGWGGALLLTLLPFLFIKFMVLPDIIQPFIGNFKCFWEDRPGNYATALFYHLPHLLIEICNTVLCIKTIIYCLRVKNEIRRINDANRGKKKIFSADKERLKLIIKLAVIMGVSFLFEVVSAFFNMQSNVYTKIIEIVWDNFNLLQGVFIFIIFICKKKILNNLLSKFRTTERKISSSTTYSTTTQITDTATIDMGALNGSGKMQNPS